MAMAESQEWAALGMSCPPTASNKARPTSAHISVIPLWIIFPKAVLCFMGFPVIAVAAELTDRNTFCSSAAGKLC